MGANLMDRVEYKFALKLMCIPRNTNAQSYSFFLTSLERLELVKTCIDIRILFDWNFSFKNFYDGFTNYHYPSLEFLWNLNILQVMPLETYILNIYPEKKVFEKFIKSVLKLFVQHFEENSGEQYLVQTGFLCYFVNKAFSNADVTNTDEKIKKICLGTIKSLLQDIFSFGKDEINAKRFRGFFSLWNAGIIEETSLLHFCSFAVDFYLNLLPIVNDLDAFQILEDPCANVSSDHLLIILEKLLKVHKAQRVASILTTVVRKDEINSASLLVVVKTFLRTHMEASTCLSKLLSELMNEAYEKLSHKILLRSLLIGYQATCQQDPVSHIQYKLWFQSIFRDCSRSKNKGSYFLLLQVLSNIVPFHKNIEYLKAVIESNCCVQPEAQAMYADYIILLKTRIQDLKPSSKPEETVEKALALFENLGKIPPVVMEISLLQKHKFLNEFLPALLVPRMVPPIPDVRERFIEALNKAGKIPDSILQKYKEGCTQKQNKIIEDINMIDEDFNDFLHEDIS